MGETQFVSAATDPAAASAPSTEVYAVVGAEPELQAYAMAKYSRSALSLRDSLREISQQKAEKFLNTFYFQYGHRSIADLAHIALAIERLSILAAIALADESRWDGQERSTRYQDFRQSGYYTPDFSSPSARELYRRTVEGLFDEYHALSEGIFRYLVEITPRPDSMKIESYERTLKARSFDVSRYLLPLATNTSLGEIVNARTLEAQISHLLSHTHREVRRLGELLKQAAAASAYNVNHQSYEALVEQIRQVSPVLAERAQQELLRPVRVAPTLVKYAEPNPYEIKTRQELAAMAGELFRGATIEVAPAVDLLDTEPLEIELATTLLYGHCHYSYRQIRQRVLSLEEKRRREILDLGFRYRGPHDELLRPLRAGHLFRFDILMDIGGFRDLHRHRRCIQIEQPFTVEHGYEIPPELKPAGALNQYREAMEGAAQSVRELTSGLFEEAAESAQYAIPLGFRKRALFQMDFAEALYIAELRTGPGGHLSYRKVAYAMFEAVGERHPELARYFRVHDVHEPVDLLKR